MKNSKFVWLFGLLLVISLFLAACGGDDEAKDTSKDKTDDEAKPTEEATPDEEQVLNLIMASEIPTMDSV